MPNATEAPITDKLTKVRSRALNLPVTATPDYAQALACQDGRTPSTDCPQTRILADPRPPGKG